MSSAPRPQRASPERHRSSWGPTRSTLALNKGLQKAYMALYRFLPCDANKLLSVCSEVASLSYTRTMAQWRWDTSPPVPAPYGLAICAVAVLVWIIVFMALPMSKISVDFSPLTTYAKFFYASFLKPHTGDGASTGQQAALESFYKAQVCCLSGLFLYRRSYIRRSSCDGR